MKIAYTRILADGSIRVERGMGIGKYNEHLSNELAINEGAEVAYTRFDHDWNSRSARLFCLKCINSVAFRTDTERRDPCAFVNCAMPFRKYGTATAVTVHGFAVFNCADMLPFSRAMIDNTMRCSDAYVLRCRRDWRMNIGIQGKCLEFAKHRRAEGGVQ